MAVNLPYVITMGTAIVLGSLLLNRSQRGLPITSAQKSWIGFGAFCGAMIGSKLPFLWGEWDGLFEPSNWMGHGKTIMCGMVGGYLGVEAAKYWSGVTVKTGDTFAIPVAISVAVGRVACFFGGCCYGTPSQLPWAVVFPSAADDPSCGRHPTQIYEAIFHLAAAMGLLLLQEWQWFNGQRIKLYFLCYLAYRFASEFIRTEPRGLLGLTNYQWACLALMPLFAILWIHDRRQIVSANQG